MFGFARDSMFSNWFSRPKYDSDRFSVKLKWDKRITRLCDVLIKLANSGHFEEDMEFECLKIIFVETRNDKADIMLVQRWIQDYLALHFDDDIISDLVDYVKLFRPECVISEIDTLEEVAKKRPLHVDIVSGMAGRDKWCYRASKLMLQDRKERFISKRKMSTELIRHLHSASFALFDKEEHRDAEFQRQPPPRLTKKLRLVQSSQSVRGEYVSSPKVYPTRHSIDGSDLLKPVQVGVEEWGKGYPVGRTVINSEAKLPPPTSVLVQKSYDDEPQELTCQSLSPRGATENGGE